MSIEQNGLHSSSNIQTHTHKHTRKLKENQPLIVLLFSLHLFTISYVSRSKWVDKNQNQDQEGSAILSRMKINHRETHPIYQPPKNQNDHKEYNRKFVSSREIIKERRISVSFKLVLNTQDVFEEIDCETFLDLGDILIPK